MATRDEIRTFVDSIGRADLQERLGLRSPSAITNAIRRGGLPAEWFPAAENLSSEKGVACDRGFFRFREGAVS